MNSLVSMTLSSSTVGQRRRGATDSGPGRGVRIVAWLLMAFALLAPRDGVAASVAPSDAPPVVLVDERGDGDGPGSYVLPRGPAFRRGAFDVVRVTLRPAGGDVAIEVQLGGPLPIAHHARAGRDTWGSYLLLQVDLYVDTDRVPGSGETRTVPGRRVLIDEREAWEHALVLSALPGRVSAGLRMAVPDLVSRVHVAAPRHASGRSIEALVPQSALGGLPSPDWGYTVLVSSVTLSTSLRGLVLGRGDDANIYTREVTPVRGSCENWEEAPDGRPCTFGGCDPCGAHPRVLDAIVGGAGGSREQLAGYAEARWAVVRGLVPSRRGGPEHDDGGARPTSPTAPPTAPPPVPLDRPLTCPGGGRFPVSDLAGDLVTIVAPERGALDEIGPGSIGDLLDADRVRVGRGVVISRKGTVLVLSRVEGGDPATTPPVAVSFRCREE